MNFDECFKKHFPLGESMYSILADCDRVSIEEFTLTLLERYNGSYELEDSLLGALIMHVKLKNIKGFFIDELIGQLNWSSDFSYDVYNNLSN